MSEISQRDIDALDRWFDASVPCRHASSDSMIDEEARLEILNELGRPVCSVGITTSRNCCIVVRTLAGGRAIIGNIGEPKLAVSFRKLHCDYVTGFCFDADDLQIDSYDETAMEAADGAIVKILDGGGS